MKIKSITTGFLSGNLTSESNIDLVATSKKYAAACEAALQEKFPDAEINVDWQEAYGALPATLKTRVEIEDGDYRDEEDAIRDVDDICSNIFEKGDFWVENQAEEENPSSIIAECHRADVQNGMSEEQASESDDFSRRLLGMDEPEEVEDYTKEAKFVNGRCTRCNRTANYCEC